MWLVLTYLHLVNKKLPSSSLETRGLLSVPEKFTTLHVITQTHTKMVTAHHHMSTNVDAQS